MKNSIVILLLALIYLKGQGQSAGGVLNSNTVVCAGQNNGTLTLTSYSGSIVRWEFSTGSNGPWSPIIFTSPSYNYINLTQSYYFRAVVQETGYQAAYSTVAYVQCDQASLPAIVSGSTLQCPGLPLTASAAVPAGHSVLWEASTTSWIITSSVAVNVHSISIPFNSSIKIRVKTKNGVCPAVTSNTLTVLTAQIPVSGNITGPNVACAGSNTINLALTGYTGTIEHWENSSLPLGPWNTINSSNFTPSVSMNGLTQNSYYRAKIKNANCAAVITPVHSVTIDPQSNPGYVSGTSSVCAGINSGTLNLQNYSGTILSWQYSDDSGANWTTLAGNNPGIVFSNIATSRIYKATTQSGVCPMSTTPHYTVSAKPLPALGFTTANVCQNAPVTVQNSVSLNTQSWDFGNGFQSSLPKPSIQYNTSGTYILKLTGTNSSGCTDSLKVPITIYPQPVASFAAPDSLCYGSGAQFSSLSTISSGNIQQHSYFFGDGSAPVTSLNINYFFTQSKNYQVKLKVSSNHGCFDSLTRNITVLPKPLADFNFENVCHGVFMSFKNSSQIQSGTLNHQWSFGEGGIATLPDPQYKYAVPGTYTTTLIVTSEHKCGDTTSKTVNVHHTPIVTLKAQSVCQGVAVNFTTSVLPANIQVHRSVAYGDGATDTIFPHQHFYSKAGIYHPELHVTTDSGCKAAEKITVAIYERPQAEFIAENSCQGKKITIRNLSGASGGTLNYLWNSAEGSRTDENPDYHFTTSGEHTIALVASNANGCADTIIKTVKVYDQPQASFKAPATCNGHNMQFRNETISGEKVSSYDWDFGDNTSSGMENPEKEYLNPGTYPVRLIATNIYHCADSITKNIVILENPVADFTMANICFSDPLRPENKSIMKTSSFVPEWHFGDGAISTLLSPEHYFRTPGIFKIQLTVSSAEGCMDSISREVTVYSLPQINAGEDILIEKGFAVTLKAEGAKKYHWYPATNLNNPVISNPSLTPLSDSEYIVTGTDHNGCSNTDTVKIKVKEEHIVIPYNIITPNKDGMNDRWVVQNIESYPDNHVIIFDINGNLIFETENYKNDFEGVTTGGDLLPDGTYYYSLSFKNSSRKYKGHITLMRNGR